MVIAKSGTSFERAIRSNRKMTLCGVLEIGSLGRERRQGREKQEHTKSNYPSSSIGPTSIL